MHSRTRALIAVAALAVLAAGCTGNQTKPEQPAPEQASAAPPPPPAAAAAPAKPECPPEPTGKKKAPAKKTSSKKGAATPPQVDCEPAKPKADAAKAKGEPAAASAAGKSCNPCVVKSRDGSFDGEVYGTIPPGSKWAKLQIGMDQKDVERILGVSHNVHAYPTAKAWIPFYYGTDSTRYEVRYPGQGSVSFTGGSWGGGQGVLMMINYDPSVQ